MSNTFLTEAFQALSLLKEETFDVTRDDLSALRDFLDVEDDTVEIIDTEADTVDDLKDTYIGKVILECPVCTSMVYKDKDAIELNDELAVANEEEECPYCHTAGGFKIIGEVSEFNPDADMETDTEVDIEDEEEVDLEPIGENIVTRKTDQVCSVVLDGKQIFTGTKEECEKYIKTHECESSKARGGFKLLNTANVYVNEALTAYIDLSGSQAGKQKEYEKVASKNGATKIITFTDGLFKPVIEGAKEGKVLLITGDDDYKVNAPELVNNKNVKVIHVGETKAKRKNKHMDEALTEKKSSKSLYELIYGTEAPVTEELEEDEIEEEELKEAAGDGKVTLQVDYIPWTDDGYLEYVISAKVSGKDLRHALMRMVSKMDEDARFLSPEEIEEKNLTAEEIIDSIPSMPDLGDDYIIMLKNLTTGEVLMNSYDEADWDDEDWDEEEELEESTATDLVIDRRETSIDASDGEKPMREGLGDVKIELDGKEIKVKEDEIKIKELAPEISEESTEVITPIENETEFIDTIPTDEEEDNDYIDIDIDEIDENAFDDLAESYLVNTFDNVKKYRTTGGYIDKNAIVLEGLITYKSGKTLATKFKFESKHAKNARTITLEGTNKHLVEAFSKCELTGRMRAGKLVPKHFKAIK